MTNRNVVTVEYFSPRRIALLAWASLWIALLFLIPTTFSHAQNTSHTVTLDNANDVINISPFAYITPDEDRTLSVSSLVDRHQNNLKGVRKNTSVINLGMSDTPQWLLFSIDNNTDTKHWILDFGKSVNGRVGLAKTVQIMNYTTAQTATYPKPDGDKISQPEMLGSAIPVQIAPHTNNIIVIYVESASGQPLVFAPKLISQSHFLHNAINGDLLTFIAAVLFVTIIAFFVGSYYITRHGASIALVSYYAIISALYFNTDAAFVENIIFNGPILLALHTFSFIPLFIAVKYMNYLTYDHHPIENMVFSILIVFILISSSLFLALFGYNPSALAIFAAIICLCISILCVIFFLSCEKPMSIRILFTAGVALSPLPFCFTTLMALNIIPASQIIIILSWMIYIPQSMLFCASYLKSNAYRKLRKKQEGLVKAQDEMSLVRLQKSKDSADKARLLRVIERERELMSELREREVKRTEEMRKSKEIADKANQDKSAFLAVVSHEIRTPMNGIMGMVQLLQNTSLTSTQTEYTETIRKSGDTMMTLLNDILDFEKIEKGAMDLEIVQFNLKQLINDIVMLMSGHAAQKNVEIRAKIAEDAPELIMGDPTRLRQILLNLTNNALKFTEKGHVEIGVKTQKFHDESGLYTLFFYVEDTGIGISQDAQEKLFTPFTQAEASTSRKYGGTGLGLAISNRLVEAMKGKISVNSTEGEGSTFSFAIQMPKPNEHNTSAGSEKKDGQQDTRPMKILIAEDNEMNRKVLEGFLEQKGHTLIMASNGIEAIEKCQSEDPELILMDIQMGEGLSGVDATHRIRGLDNMGHAKTPIIALTGNVLPEHIEEYFSAGMNGFMSKPINAKELYNTIHNASLGKFEHNLSENFFEKNKKDDFDIESMSVGLELDDREDFTHDTTPVTPRSDGIKVTSIKTPPPPITRLSNSTPAQEEKTPAPITPPPISTITSTPTPSSAPAGNMDHAPKQKEETKIHEYLRQQKELKTGAISQETKTDPSPSDTSPMGSAPSQDMPSAAPPAPKEEPPIMQTEQPNLHSEQTELPSAPIEPQSTIVVSSPPTPAAPPAQQDTAQEIPHTSTAEPEHNTPQDIQPSAGSTYVPAPPPAPKEEPQQHAPETPAEPHTEQPMQAAAPQSDSALEDWLDLPMLNSLKDALGEEPFKDLLKGFIEKAEEIVDTIEGLIEENNISSMGARGHELKGMAGNFGMSTLSNIAGEIEKAAKTQNGDGAIKEAKKLRATYIETQAALDNWIKG